jgi:ethanolamine utilization protein EutQ (cupin superfamily)
MSEYIKEVLQTPVAGNYDVIVAGGGPSGVAAAIAAGRMGMKTLLVERYGFLGGNFTAALVNPLFDVENKGGIVKELIDKLKQRNAWGGFEGHSFDYENIKLLLDEMVSGADVDILFQSNVVAALKTGDRVTGLILENKSGRCAYYGKVLIDCTGDGDLAALSGAEFAFGRDGDHLTQAMTLMFVVGNIHYDQRTRDQLYQLMQETIRRKKFEFHIQYQYPYFIMLPDRNKAVAQMTHIYGKSGINAVEMSEAYVEARKEVMRLFTFFKENIIQFKDLVLEQTGAQMGVRESRRIIGEYVLNVDDLLAGRKFDDGIAIASFPVDIHQPDKDGQDVRFPKPYHIPYRCLVPKTLDGLLVAGRCISGTHEAHGSYRVAGNCMAMGEAAGVAAAIAVHDGVQPRKISIQKLKETLLKNNVILSLETGEEP